MIGIPDNRRELTNRRFAPSAANAVRKLVWLVLAVVLLPFALLRLWLRRWPSHDAPVIGLSLDDRWLHEMGVTRIMYDLAIARAGGHVKTLRFSNKEPLNAAGDVKELLSGIDGLVLSGGGDVDPTLYGRAGDDSLNVKPWRDRFEMELVKEAQRRRMPVLGICRGCQLINVALGGTLQNLACSPDQGLRHFSWRGHPIEITDAGRRMPFFDLDIIPRVNSFHRQSLLHPGRDVQVLARAPDGVIEAIQGDCSECRPSWIVGVQWHPEFALWGPPANRLFGELIHQAKMRRSED